MRRWFVTLTLALVALLAALSTCVSAVDKICAAAEMCIISGRLNICDRTKKDCPPCVSKGLLALTYDCAPLNENRQCPEDASYCPPLKDKDSGSGSTTHEPTTTTPQPTTATPAPTTAKPTPTNSNSNAGSLSDSDTAAGSMATTKPPTTKKPTNTTKPVTTKPVPTETPSATPVPTPIATEPLELTVSPSSARSSQSDSLSDKMHMILGIAGGSVGVIAVIGFLIWKKRRDDDDDSDDEDELRFKTAKPTARAVGTGGAGATGASDGGNGGNGGGYGGGYGNSHSVSTTASYTTSTSTYPPALPIAQTTSQYGGGGGAKYPVATSTAGSNQYASGNQYQYDLAYGGAAGGNGRGKMTSDRISLSDSMSSNDDRDVWGNAPAHKSSASTFQQPVYQPRDKRTLSNVSIEF